MVIPLIYKAAIFEIDKLHTSFDSSSSSASLCFPVSLEDVSFKIKEECGGNGCEIIM